MVSTELGDNDSHREEIDQSFVTCREDREHVYKSKAKLKNTQIYITDDVPEETREIRRKLLVPAMKRIKQTNLNAKVTIVGDRLLHDGYFYQHNKIPSRWLLSEDPEDEWSEQYTEKLKAGQTIIT